MYIAVDIVPVTVTIDAVAPPKLVCCRNGGTREESSTGRGSGNSERWHDGDKKKPVVDEERGSAGSPCHSGALLQTISEAASGWVLSAGCWVLSGTKSKSSKVSDTQLNCKERNY